MYNPEKPYKKDILAMTRRTLETSYLSVKDGIMIKKFEGLESLPHTDGVGTKGIFYWMKRNFHGFVLDALAMNLNDLAFDRARPYALNCHLFMPEDDHKAIVEIMHYLSEECIDRKIAITGGETALHDNIRGMEMSITMLGFKKNTKLNRILPGDVLIGFGSSGLHSNAFTEVRKLLGEEPRPEFIIPTKIYLDTILELDEKYDIHGMMHITGGAYTKLKPLLCDADAIIERNHYLEPQDIFREIYSKGIPDSDMYKTFNCGVGFVLSVNESDAGKIIGHVARSSNFKSAVIGKVVSGVGRVIVNSKFSDKTVIYQPDK